MKNSQTKNSPKELRKLREEKLSLLEELKRRRVEEKLRYWQPHEKQKKFYQAEAKKRLVLGGNRSGKTEAGIIEAISHAIGYRLFLDEDDPNYKVNLETPSVGRILGEDFTNHLGNVIIPKLKNWIPKSEFQGVKKNARGQETMWLFKNGSSIELMSYEQESDKFEGWAGDWVYFDEPPPRDIYIACLRGLVDMGGRMWFTMTPLKEPWIYNELWLNEQKDPDIWCVSWDIQDNVGFGLQQVEVDKFEKSLNEDEKAARLHGQFRFLTGLIYKDFDPYHHVIDPFEIPKDWSIYEAIDPHARTPHAVLWLAVSPDGVKYVFDELFKRGEIKDIAEFMKAKRKGRKVNITLIDASACTPNPVGGVNVQSEFTRCQIYTVKGSKELAAGINRIQHALKKVNGKSELYVFRSCVETIKEFQLYIWDDYRGRTKDYKGQKEKPVDKDDHMLENLYRLLLFNPRYQVVNRADFDREYRPNNTRTGY